jgi:hypothetical protein
MQATAASGAPQLQMAQATLVLQPLGNSSDATAATDVLVGVQLLGGASGPVTASLRLLLPPGNASASQPGNGPSSSNTSSSGSGGSTDDGAWAPADPAELWLEPSSLTWRAGEPAGAKRVRLRSAAELPLAAVLGEALYAAAGAASPSDAGGSGAPAGSAASAIAAGQPLLRVQLHNSRGADIDQQRSSTTVLLDAEGGGGSHGAQAVAGSGVGEAADAGLPLFGFVANQAAYPPTSSDSTDGSSSSSSNTTNSSSGVASIPVRLLAGQVRGRATLRYVVSELGGTAAAGGSSTRPQRQFLASKALSGFIQFDEAQAESPAAAPSPAPATATSGANPTSGSSTTRSGNVAGSARAAPGLQQEQLVLLPLAWDRILPGAELRLGLELFPVFGARVQPQPDAVALHVFGSPLGSCPPGSALKDGGSGGSGAAHTLTTSDDGFTGGLSRLLLLPHSHCLSVLGACIWVCHTHAQKVALLCRRACLLVLSCCGQWPLACLPAPAHKPTHWADCAARFSSLLQRVPSLACS